MAWDRDGSSGVRVDGVARLRLSLLGGFRAERGGWEVPPSTWKRRTARALVALLAAEPEHSLHREQIQDLLWEEQPNGTAYESFRKVLQVARHALQPELNTKGDIGLSRAP